jgi:Flp pilus assembly protein TadG
MVGDMRTRRRRNERGAALIEAAVTIPLLLLISVAIFEFGRAYQTWQVLTNAAREGARVAVIAGTSNQAVTDAVRNYMNVGRLPLADSAPIVIDRSAPLGPNNGSQVTINYPFEFMVIGPIARMINPTSSTGSALTMSAVAIMRNEN